MKIKITAENAIQTCLFFAIGIISFMGCKPLNKSVDQKEAPLLEILSNATIARYFRNVSNDSKIYVSPLLKYRTYMPPDFTISALRCDGSITPDSLPIYPLQIPESQKNILHYYMGTDQQAVNDSVYVYFFSPLIPTNNQSEYYLQEVTYFSDKSSGWRLGISVCYRVTLKNDTISTIVRMDETENAHAWEN